MFGSRRIAGSVLTIAVCVLGGSLPADAQDSHCDPDLKRLADRLRDTPERYQQRGDRCEGKFIEQVSGSTVEIVSFTSAFADYSLDSGKHLIVEWPTFGGEDIRLRGRSLEPKIHYRMDSVRPGDSASFLWPVDVLTPLRISKGSLGVVGTIRHQVGAEIQTVLVPLRIVQAEQPPTSERFELRARPSVELEEVYITLEALNAEGAVREYLMDEKALEFGFYPAERAFDVPLPDDLQRGLYRLSIAASLAHSGGTATAEAFLLHSHAR